MQAIRKAYPGEEWDWFHLTGFIHDLGKLLLLPKFGGLPQWAVVGDTFPVGCRFDGTGVGMKGCAIYLSSSHHRSFLLISLSLHPHFPASAVHPIHITPPSSMCHVAPTT